METYLNMGIKEIISRFPEIEDVLNEYDIGCGPCGVGTCLLKDIVEIHQLPEDKKQKMMGRISAVIHSGRGIKTAEIREKPQPAPKEIQYSLPMKKLVDEHVFIKKMASLLPAVVARLDVDSVKGRRRITDVVDFIRSYADKFHHAKEEDILFKYFDGDLTILKVMHQDHQQARNHVKDVLEGLDRRDKESVAKHLTAYSGLLNEHIQKEDTVLFPWMDRNLNIMQTGDLFAEFNAAEAEIGFSPSKYEAFVASLEREIHLETPPDPSGEGGVPITYEI